MSPAVDSPLEYARDAVDPRRRRLANAALGLSLGATACLAVSVTMFLVHRRGGAGWGGVQSVQVMLAWTSIVIGGAALPVALVAIVRNPRGGREIAALTASLVHAALVPAAFKYL